jgi:hypothetical protein
MSSQSSVATTNQHPAHSSRPPLGQQPARRLTVQLDRDVSVVSPVAPDGLVQRKLLDLRAAGVAGEQRLKVHLLQEGVQLLGSFQLGGRAVARPGCEALCRAGLKRGRQQGARHVAVKQPQVRLRAGAGASLGTRGIRPLWARAQARPHLPRERSVL